MKYIIGKGGNVKKLNDILDGNVYHDKKNGLLIIDNVEGKVIRYPHFNCVFDKKNGNTITYGDTKNDDPTYCKYGPIIVDIEITTICSGPKGKLCSFCYKSNNPFGKNMSIDTFKQVFDNLPPTVTQIAFGADASCTSNPDIWDIMNYTRDHGVIPNITVADITDDVAQKLSDVCGAVAVSRYDDKDVCYDSIKRLIDCGMKQVNMHICIHSDNFDQVKETLKDIIIDKDPRLENLNAIVFLSLKKKGRGENYDTLSQFQFTEIVDTCLSYGIKFGFDSCSAIKFLKSIEGHEFYDQMYEMAEPCESSSFSAYINVDGSYFPCSFIEGTDGWENGFDVIHTPDFVKDVWNSEQNIIFRDKCLECRTNGISCQTFDI